MKLHRFYTAGKFELDSSLWIDDKELFHQWIRVLRFEPGRELILFDNRKQERLYKIEKIGDNAVNLTLVTELIPKLPLKDIYLCFSLLKKDKNDWVLQKATELGVRHFVPLICDRTEKTGFDRERAEKIVIEASEQCGRSDIPRVRDPIHVTKLIEELDDKVKLFVGEQSSSDIKYHFSDIKSAIGILIGPEGGWSDSEKKLFKENNIEHLSLSEFTLRAETACVSALALLQYS